MYSQLLLGAVVLILGGVVGGCMLMPMPGKSHKGNLAAITADENLLSVRLKSHVVMLAETIGERNVSHYGSLKKSAAYIKDSFAQFGYTVREEPYTAGGKTVMNIIAEQKGLDRSNEIVIVGAHYDSPQGSPGANDNASGVAAMLELAKCFKDVKSSKTLRFVAFVNEEQPWFQTELMGSRVHAAGARKRGENISYMMALETIGYYSDSKGSQKYPFPVNCFYPETGNFIAFVGNSDSRKIVRSTVEIFRKTTQFPSEAIAAPDMIKGVGWSDQWSFWQEGYPGLMVTDTAPFRYHHYHEASDTPDKLDYQRMARVVKGMGKVLEEQIK